MNELVLVVPWGLRLLVSQRQNRLGLLKLLLHFLNLFSQDSDLILDLPALISGIDQLSR